MSDEIDTIGAELRRHRVREFVGREHERRRFAALVDPRGSCRVLAVVGPGGIGKTSFMSVCCDVVASRGGSVWWTDGAEIAIAPQLVDIVFAPVLAAPPDLLVIDGFEHCWNLGDPICERLVARLPSTTRVLIGSRRPLEWQQRLGWARLFEQLSLAPLQRAEARQLLSARGVPEILRERAVDASRGHPLALALLADLIREDGETQPTLEALPTLKTLVEQLVNRAPSDDHWRALVTLAVVRRLHPNQLRATLSGADSTVLYQWLESLSCVESRGTGLHPHDIARDAILGYIRQRDPGQLQTLGDTLYPTLVTALEGATDEPEELNAALRDALFVVSQMMHAPFVAVDSDAALALRAANPSDWLAIGELVRRFEGEAAWGRLQLWRPHLDACVVESPGGSIEGFAAILRFEEASETLIASDPGTRALAQVHASRGLESGEGAAVRFARWWAGSDWHLPNAAQSVLFQHFLATTLLTPDLAMMASAHHPPAFWRPLLAASALEAFEGGDFQADDRDFSIIGVDLRERPASRWIAEHLGRMLSPVPLQPIERPVVSRDDEEEMRTVFDVDRVRKALRDLHDLPALARSPLCDTALVGQREPTDNHLLRALALRALIETAAAEVFAGSEDLRPVFEKTYLFPEGKQLATAEMLGLSHSTYRRRLHQAVHRLAAELELRRLAVERA